jgi:hypothetical protein
MSHFDQRGPCVAEKVMAQESRRDTTGTRRKIGSTCCGAVAGMSLHAPMT